MGGICITKQAITPIHTVSDTDTQTIEIVDSVIECVRKHITYSSSIDIDSCIQCVTPIIE